MSKNSSIRTLQQLHDPEYKEEEGAENFILCDRIDVPLVEPEMIFPDLWPARTIGLFTGDGGIGKTHFTLQLLVLIASGGEIVGTPFQCTTPRPVIYISQEDEGAFLTAELRAQFPDLKSKPEITQRIRIISTALQGPNLYLTDMESRRYLEEHLPEGSVFVLDSWSTFLTSNENDNTELLRREITALRGIMKKRKATPFLIHHRPKPNPQTGNQSSFRGGTVLPNNCRFHIMIESRGGEVKLSFEKVSRGSKPDPATLIFDEERRLFVPKELDRYVAAFKVGEELTTTQFMEKIGKDPKNDSYRKQALDILRQRSKGGMIMKVSDSMKGKEAVWKRVK